MGKKRGVIALVVLLIGLGPASVGTAAAADAAINDVSITDTYDRDGDGKYSAFTVSIDADTRVGGFTPSPYFKIYVNDQLVRTTDTVSVTQSGEFEYSFSQEALADFSTGEPKIRVELWDSQTFGDEWHSTYSHTPAGEFEPASEDFSPEKRALLGINSLEEPYTAAGQQLDVTYLQQEQISYVSNAFEVLLPTTSEEVSIETVTSILEAKTPVPASWVGSLLAVPPVVDNVDSSLDAGTQANTLTKTEYGTRSDFHLYLDDLQQKTENTGTDPSTVSDAELQNRLDTIEKVYEHSREYESEVRNTYTDNQQYMPDIILALYGADQESLKQVEGQFTQLEQNLIADYYYTQLALNPNQQPQNLTTVVGYQESSYPEAKITGYDIPETATAGEPTTVSVTVKTENADTPSQTVTTGFPDSSKVRDVEISDNGLPDPSYQNVYDSGSQLWSDYGDEQRTIDYPVAETASSISAGNTHTVEITFVPTETGTVRLWFKSIAWTETGASGSLVPDPRSDGSSVVTDGQDEFAYEKTITVEAADSDGDGVPDSEDECPNSPEDEDGYQDSDGCPENPAPSVTVNDEQVQEEQSTSISVNGDDPEGEPLSYEWTLDGEGSLSGNGDTVTYDAPSDISSDKSPTVTVSVTEPDEGKSAQDSATISVSDTEAPNSPPTANDVSVSTTEGSSVSGTFSASDPDGDSLSYTIESTPSDGTVSVSGDSFTYTPESISSGTDSFVYRVNDGNGGTDTATVTIDISASEEQNQPPEVTLDVNPASAEVGQSVTFDGTGTSDSDGRITEYRWDFDGDGTIDRATSTETVTYTYAEAGSYTPELIAVDDGGARGSDTATVSVGSENVDPIANDINVSTSEDSPVSETFSVSDPDGDSLSYTIESPPSDGTVSVSGDSFTYTPESISSGTDSFVYRVNDGNGGTDTATVSITVTEPNTNDGYEPNDEFDTAASITDGSYSDLQIVDGESDYFAVTLEEGGSIDASIGFDHNTGDLDMALYGPDREELADSTSTSDGESVSATDVSEGGTYYVEVRGFSGASAPYDLRVDVGSPQPTGVIIGDVVDTETNPIPGAQVRITNASDSVIAETTTDSSGIYTVEVPPGEYTVIVESNGSTTERTVLVEPGATINADVVIQTAESESVFPSVIIRNAPDRIGPNETFVIEYGIENTGTVAGPFVLDIPAPTPGVTVQDIDGDIQGSDTSAEPVTAATNRVRPNETIAVSVTYDANDLSTEDITLELTARQPLDSTSDSVSSTITVTESTDPTERALQRFDGDGDGTIDRDEAVGAIVAYNIGTTIGGEEVTRTQVVRAIVAYNTGESVNE